MSSQATTDSPDSSLTLSSTEIADFVKNSRLFHEDILDTILSHYLKLSEDYKDSIMGLLSETKEIEQHCKNDGYFLYLTKDPTGFTKWALNILTSTYAKLKVEIPDILHDNIMKDIESIEVIGNKDTNQTIAQQKKERIRHWLEDINGKDYNSGSPDLNNICAV